MDDKDFVLTDEDVSGLWGSSPAIRYRSDLSCVEVPGLGWLSLSAAQTYGKLYATALREVELSAARRGEL